MNPTLVLLFVVSAFPAHAQPPKESAAYEAFTTGRPLGPSASGSELARLVGEIQSGPAVDEKSRQARVQAILKVSSAFRAQGLPGSAALPATADSKLWAEVYQGYLTGRRDAPGRTMSAEQRARMETREAQGLSQARRAARIDAGAFGPDRAAGDAGPAAAASAAAGAPKPGAGADLPGRQLPVGFSMKSAEPPAPQGRAPAGTDPSVWAKWMKAGHEEYSQDQERVNAAMRRLSSERGVDCASAMSASCVGNTATMGWGVFKTFLNETGKAFTGSGHVGEQTKALGVFVYENSGIGGAIEAVRTVGGEVKAKGVAATFEHYRGDKLEAAMLIGSVIPGGRAASKGIHGVETALREAKSAERAVASAVPSHVIQDLSHADWQKAVVGTNPALTEPLRATASGVSPRVTVTRANGETVSGTLLGLDQETKQVVIRRPDGTLAHIEPGERVPKVVREADVFVEGGDIRQTHAVVHDLPAVAHPYQDLTAYKGQKVDIHVRDLDDPKGHSRMTVSGTVTKVDPKTKTITLMTPQGESEVSAEFFKIEKIDQDLTAAAFSSRGNVGHNLDINKHVPLGTPVELSLPKNQKVEGIFRGVEQDARGPYAIVEDSNGRLRGYREFGDLKTAAPKRGEAPRTQSVYVNPEP